MDISKYIPQDAVQESSSNCCLHEKKSDLGNPEKSCLNQNRRHCKKSRKSMSVIPAKSGIQSFHVVRKAWIPFFKGMTTFCSDIRTESNEKIVKEARRHAREGENPLFSGYDERHRSTSSRGWQLLPVNSNIYLSC